MGRYPDKALAGTKVLGVPINPETPLEDPERGCPGAWYRTAYIDSLWRYFRKRIEGGGRVPNPLFDQADWQIQSAVMQFEYEQDRWSNYIATVRQDRQEARDAKASKEAHGGRRGRR
jgi:hypothetical protein